MLDDMRAPDMPSQLRRHRRGTLVLFVACAGAFLSAVANGGCAEADGTVSGGEPRFDADPPAQVEEDSGASEGGAPEDLVDAGSGTTWTDLYRDLFGKTGAANCAGTGACHGTADESGSRGSGGFVCADQEGCRASMLSANTSMVQTRDFSAPEGSVLVQTLRRRTSSGTIAGTMPKTPRYVFSASSIARVETWIGNGAPND